MSSLTGGLEDIEKNLSTLERFLYDFPDKAFGLGIRILLALIAFFIGSKIIKLIRKILEKSLKKAKVETGVIQFLDAFVKLTLYVVLVVLIAGRLGYDATGIVALLGSAGVTLGLALQGSLSNLAGGVLILVLKPFRVGDYIKEDSHGNEGTVKEVGIFYTKLQTIDHKVVVLPNGTLANNSVINYSTSPYRRVDITVGISYSADIKKAKDILKDLVESDPDIVKNQPISIFVDSLGTSEVVLGARGYCKNSLYWDVKWRLIEKIKLTFDEQEIEIPFQHITLHMDK